MTGISSDSARRLLGLLLFLCGLIAVSAANAAQEKQAAGRVLHVSPQPLATVAAARQFRTVDAAARAVAPGDTVLLHSGVYREAVIVEKRGTKERPIRFEAAPAANVVITGADRLLDWRREGDPGSEDNIYSADWPHDFIPWSETRTHPGDDTHRLIGRAEQIHVDNYPLQQVLRREQLSRGTFFADTANKRLYVWASNNATLAGDRPDGMPRVEASVRPTLWECKGDYVHLRGVHFRWAANAAQQPAAQFKGKNDVVEDCVFEGMNAIGAGFFGPDQIVRRCTFRDNGQMGWSANGAHNLLFTGCLTRNNNTKNFSRGWEAGGDKIVLSRGVVIEKSRFEENRGNGIWFDIGNENSTVRNCLIADNEEAGIFYEISYGLHVRDNVIVGNGFGSGGGSWGAASGVSLSSSPGCVIERNLILGNKEGFNFREQGRTTPRIGARSGAREEPVWNHDQIIRNNILAYNRDAQTWGWFDVADERHWPAARQEKRGDAGKPRADIAAGYQAKDGNGPPPDLSLEKLRITFANNLYAVSEGQGLFRWGTSWRRHAYYEALNAVRAELGLERGSRAAPLTFADTLTRDFRVPPNSPARAMGCYPQGEVPGVRLGILKP